MRDDDFDPEERFDLPERETEREISPECERARQYHQVMSAEERARDRVESLERQLSNATKAYHDRIRIRVEFEESLYPVKKFVAA